LPRNMNKKRNKGSSSNIISAITCDKIRGFENRGLIDMEFDDEANGDRDIRKNGQTRLFHLNYRASCLIGIRGFLASRHRSLRHMGIQYKIERNNYGSGENKGNYKREATREV
jgi:hypothetical protein